MYIAIVRYNDDKIKNICVRILNISCARYHFEHIMCSITKIDELTNLPKDHWRVLAITKAGRSFILYVDCICDRCCIVI